jgi:hypothetical protein
MMESARWQTVSLVRAVTVTSTYWRTGASEANRMYGDGRSLPLDRRYYAPGREGDGPTRCPRSSCQERRESGGRPRKPAAQRALRRIGERQAASRVWG